MIELLIVLIWLLTAEPAAQEPPDQIQVRTVWDRLADCESGLWDRHGIPIRGTADWGYDDGVYEGGLNFHPDTWDWLRPDSFPESAADASRRQEIVVAGRVLDVQGWKAWPVCSRKIGVRP